MSGAPAEPREATADEAIDMTFGGLGLYPEPEDRSKAERTEFGNIEYVDDILRAGRIMVVAAEEGTGKSYAISGEMGLRLATKTGAFAETWEIKEQANVLYLSEMHTDDDLAREDEILGSLLLSRKDLAGHYYRQSIYTATKDKPPLADPKWCEFIIEFCKTKNINVLIFDTATSSIDIEAWGKEFQSVFRSLRAMIAEHPGGRSPLARCLNAPRLACGSPGAATHLHGTAGLTGRGGGQSG